MVHVMAYNVKENLLKKYTIQDKTLDIFFSTYFYDYLKCTFSLKASELRINTWSFLLDKKDEITEACLKFYFL